MRIVAPRNSFIEFIQ